MKAVLAALVVLAILSFIFTDIPSKVTGYFKSGHLLASVRNEFSNFIKNHWLPGKTEETTRNEILRKLEVSLGNVETGIEKQTGSLSVQSRKTIESKIAEAKDAVAELKKHTMNDSFIATLLKSEPRSSTQKNTTNGCPSQ